MGDSETAVAQTSSVTDYKSTDYSSKVPDDAGTHASSDAGNAGDLATPCPNGAGELASSNVEARNLYTTDAVSTQQEGATAMTYEASQDLAALEDAAAGSSQAAVYDSSANGNSTIEARDIAENGIASDVHGNSNMHQPEDGLALSPEEERLWSIVRTNSLDFNAWTSLIEETERMSEGNILKIQKVYDAFLAEFPLCYGYWKKYADHEARLGSVDKVVEVYERAVQGVTYSVDMWLHYCVFAISTYGDPDTIRSQVVKLYERCLIACANYPEFWIRYVSCMETSGSLDLADNALARATQVFVKRQPEIHLFAARLREQRGDIPGAQAAYQLVHAEISPGLVEAIIKHANMERRLGNLEDACSVYEQAIAIEKGKEHSQSLPLLLAQYSRFLYMVCGKVEKAREILDQAVENVQLSKPLPEALIHLESIQSLPKRIDLLDSLVDKFIVPSPENPSVASVDEREELSSIFLEFLDLFGDAASIKKADDRHAKLFLRHRTSSDSKKRQADDYLVSEKTKLANSAVAASNPSVAGAFPGAQNQWPAGYGVQGQTWPQAAQAQPQQWNPGYAQQAAYGAYSSYGASYAPPQGPAPVPSSAGYGAYPSTYPAQAFPQQNYAQPAAAPTLPPAPQATTVPPTAYYGSYY